MVTQQGSEYGAVHKLSFSDAVMLLFRSLQKWGSQNSLVLHFVDRILKICYVYLDRRFVFDKIKKTDRENNNFIGKGSVATQSF